MNLKKYLPFLKKDSENLENKIYELNLKNDELKDKISNLEKIIEKQNLNFNSILEKINLSNCSIFENTNNIQKQNLDFIEKQENSFDALKIIMENNQEILKSELKNYTNNITYENKEIINLLNKFLFQDLIQKYGNEINKIIQNHSDS